MKNESKYSANPIPDKIALHLQALADYCAEHEHCYDEDTHSVCPLAKICHDDAVALPIDQWCLDDMTDEEAEGIARVKDERCDSDV